MDKESFYFFLGNFSGGQIFLDLSSRTTSETQVWEAVRGPRGLSGARTWTQRGKSPLTLRVRPVPCQSVSQRRLRVKYRTDTKIDYENPGRQTLSGPFDTGVPQPPTPTLSLVHETPGPLLPYRMPSPSYTRLFRSVLRPRPIPAPSEVSSPPTVPNVQVTRVFICSKTLPTFPRIPQIKVYRIVRSECPSLLIFFVSLVSPADTRYQTIRTPTATHKRSPTPLETPKRVLT